MGFGLSRWAVFSNVSSSREIRPRLPSFDLVKAESTPRPATVSEASSLHEKLFFDQDLDLFCARLREAGCPGQTIARILDGEMAIRFFEKRYNLERESNSPEQKKLLLAQIDDEEQALRNHFFQTPAAPISSSRATAAEREGASSNHFDYWTKRSEIEKTTSSQAGAIAKEPATADALKVSTPLALLEIGPELQINEGQASTLESLRKDFVEKLGKIDPASPEYFKSWQELQPAMDDQIRATLGTEAFNQLQTAGVRQDSNPEPVP